MGPAGGESSYPLSDGGTAGRAAQEPAGLDDLNGFLAMDEPGITVELGPAFALALSTHRQKRGRRRPPSVGTTSIVRDDRTGGRDVDRANDFGKLGAMRSETPEARDQGRGPSRS